MLLTSLGFSPEDVEKGGSIGIFLVSGPSPLVYLRSKSDNFLLCVSNWLIYPMSSSFCLRRRFNYFCIIAFLLTMECWDWNSLLYLYSSSFSFWSSSILARERVISKCNQDYMRHVWRVYLANRVHLWGTYRHLRRCPCKYLAIWFWGVQTYRTWSYRALSFKVIQLLFTYSCVAFTNILEIFGRFTV